MPTNPIHDRGRGPEITGTRITVYNLLPYFLDPTATEEYICQIHDLKPKQVAAARAYVLNHPDEVLAEHLKIEAKIAAGNSATVIEQAKHTHEVFERFRDWLAKRDEASTKQPPTKRPSKKRPTVSSRFPTFKKWMSERDASLLKRS